MASSRVVSGLLMGVLLAGCGGKGVQLPAIPPGFYRGTITFEDVPGLVPGTAPIAADVQANGDFNAYAVSATVLADIVKQGSSGTIVFNNLYQEATIQVSPFQNAVTFTVRNGFVLLATGTLARSDLPTYGSATLLPPSGSYHGEILVVSNGHMRGFGTVVATIDESRSFVASIRGGGAWINGGLCVATIQPDGVVENAFLVMGGGQIINQSPPTSYTFDGSTLVLRYDQIALEPGSCWLIMTRVEP